VSKRQKVVWRNVRATLLALGLFWGAAALAQGATSVLTGNVVDAATKAPVADVVVTATSPSLQGEQVVVTDATGLYRVPQLPPGTYTLRFEKESYRPFARTGIDVAADRTLRLNVELLPETAGEQTVTVVGTPPTVDVGSSAVGTTISSDFVRNVPISRPGLFGNANRSFETLAAAAPQVTQDVYGLAVNGGTSPENVYLIDGLAVNNTAYGVNGSTLTSEFFDEVNVITGGYMPEYGRTMGGAVSGITKSGGNEFHGTLFGTFTPGGLAGPARQVPTGGATRATADLTNIGDFGATLGGYIIKDKLWFFAGFQYAQSRYSYDRTYYALDDNRVFQQIFNSDGSPAHTRRFADGHSYNFIAKLTYLLGSDTRVSVSFTGTPTWGGGPGSLSLSSAGLNNSATSRSILAPANWATNTFNVIGLQQKFDTYDVVGQINTAFMDKRLLVDVHVGYHYQKDVSTAVDGSGIDDINNPNTIAGIPFNRRLANENILTAEDQVPAAVRAACSVPIGTPPTLGRCPVAMGYGGSASLLSDNAQDSIQGRLTLTYLLTALGHHVIKGGVDEQSNSYRNRFTYSGGVSYSTLVGGATPITLDARRFGDQSDVDTIIDDPIKDTTVKSNIFGFFVQDSWSILDKVTLNLGLRWDTLQIKGSDGVTRISLSDQWSPRVGLVYDPTQQGRSKIYANYGRYYENIPLDISARSHSPQTQILGVEQCKTNVALRKGCDASVPVIGPNGANVPGNPSQLWSFSQPSEYSPVDPNLKSPASDEVVAGAEYEILANARLGVSYTYRNLVRTVEDMSLTNGLSFFIGNPGEGIASGTFPNAKRTYHAVTVNFTKNFSDLWLAQISYTWAKLTGNYDGLINPQGNNQIDPNINSTFDLPVLLKNQDGPLAADITHFIKIYLAKEFVITPVISTSLGGAFNANSGPPITPLGYFGGGGYPLYGNGQAFITQRGSAGRLPWVTSFDLKLTLNYRLTKDNVFSAGVEGFNLFNSQRATGINQFYTTGSANSVGTIDGATPNTIPTQYGGICPYTGSTTLADCRTALANGTGPKGNGTLPKPGLYPNGNGYYTILPDPGGHPKVVQINTAYGSAIGYQAVRQFRFTLRVTF
jgi:hypothetical protein